MAIYAVKHLDTGDTFSHPYIFHNDQDESHNWNQEVDPAIESFHKNLSFYNETSLHTLPSIASELGFQHVFLKDESTRFGLPSFKILGASWAIHRAVCQELRVPHSTSVKDVNRLLGQHSNLRLVTCTEGNWGRACARMGAHLGMGVKIYVPWFMNAYTQDLLRAEGAEVVVLDDGSYDDCIAAVKKEAEAKEGALMVLDTSWPGYEEFPQWVTEGYTTMLTETSRQIAQSLSSPDQIEQESNSDSLEILALVSVGVGSWAHAVVSYYKSLKPSSSPHKIIAVEPEAAPSLSESLHQKTITPIETGETIMNGMNCGTTSTIAWPVLKAGLEGTVVVTDVEAHQAVLDLRALDESIETGPCGAATLAALRKVAGTMDENERRRKCVVLFSTEGQREYEIPSGA